MHKFRKKSRSRSRSKDERAQDTSYEGASSEQYGDLETDSVPVPWTDSSRHSKEEPLSSKDASSDQDSGYATSTSSLNSLRKSDLHKKHGSCAKNPRHEEFIPIRKLTTSYLPQGLQFEKLVQLIKLKGDYTVRLIVLHTSRNRPKGLEVNTPPNGTRYGTGTAFLHEMENYKPCDCDQVRGHHRISGTFYVMTAGHVVFDDEEARNTYVEFFFDSEDREGVVIARGYKIVDVNPEGNRSIFECKTHDEDLYNRLKANLQQRNELIKDDLERKVNGQQTVVVISHPHGASKHVTVGKLIDHMDLRGSVRKTVDGMKLRECILKYDTPTCPGSGGGSVNVIGGGSTVSAFAPHCSSKVGHGNISGIGWAREK